MAESWRRGYLDPKTGGGPFSIAVGRERPNILLITLDMVPPEFYLPDYEGFQLETPNIDRLKARGIFFQNAFSAYPLCAPSRASYLSGRYSYIVANGERSHDGQMIHLRDEDTIFPEYLRAAGYHTRQVGKSHVGRHKFIDVFSENNSPWDRWSPPWYDDDEYHSFLRSKGLERFRFNRELYGKSPSGSGRGNFYGGWLAPQQGRPFPLEATYPAFLVDRAIRCLEAWDPANGPFYLQLDFFAPHQPFAIPGDMEDREREIRKWIRLPESFRELEANGFQPPWPEAKVYELYRAYWGLEGGTTLLDYMVANILQFELLDIVIGKLFNHMEDRGVFDSSWIAMIADHGEMNGEAGLIDKGVYLQPKILRVPILLKPPNGFSAENPSCEPGTTATATASLLDLCPTMLEIAGVETTERRDGFSLLRLAETGQRPENLPLLFEGGNHVVPNICVATLYESQGERYLYTYNVMDSQDQLYKLSGRAGENRNLLPDRADLAEQAALRLYRVLEGEFGPDPVPGQDPRWIVYRECLRLEKGRLLPLSEGDGQIFWR